MRKVLNLIAVTIVLARKHLSATLRRAHHLREGSSHRLEKNKLPRLL